MSSKKRKNRNKGKHRNQFPNATPEQLKEWRHSRDAAELKLSRAREFVNTVDGKIENHLQAIENLRKQAPDQEALCISAKQEMQGFQKRIDDNVQKVSLRKKLAEAERELSQIHVNERNLVNRQQGIA